MILDLFSDMAGNSSSASSAVAGFFTGAAVTVAAAAFSYHYLQQQREQNNDQKERTTTASATAAAASSRSANNKSSSSWSLRGGSSSARGAFSHALSARDANQTRSAASLCAATDEVSVGLISDLVVQMWSYINIAGCGTVRDAVEPSFRSLPAPLSTLRFRKLDLGSVPIRLDNIVVHETNKTTNTVQFDLDVLWDGVCDIELQADYVGSFGIESIKFHGRLTVTLSLEPVLPVVAAVQYAFINPPTLDFDLTGLAQIAEVSFIDTRVRSIIRDTINSMLVLPKRNLVRVNAAADFFALYVPPAGVVRIRLLSGRGFQTERRSMRGDDIPDVYCIVTMGGRSCRSSTCRDSVAPVWDDGGETMDYVLCDRDQIVSVRAWDDDSSGRFDADDDLGTAAVTVGQLLLSPGRRRELELQTADNKPTGAFLTLRCDVLPFTAAGSGSRSSTDDNRGPLLMSASAARGGGGSGGDDGAAAAEGNHDDKNSYCGLLTVLVAGAFDLPGKKEDAASFVKVAFQDKSFCTGTVVQNSPGVDALNPVFDSVFHVPLLTRDVSAAGGEIGAVTLSLFNGAGAAAAAAAVQDKEEDDTDSSCCLGTIEVDHKSLVAATDCTVTETRIIGDTGASVRFRVSLSGVTATADAAASGGQGGLRGSAAEIVTSDEKPTTTATGSPNANASGGSSSSPVASPGSSVLVEDDYAIISGAGGGLGGNSPTSSSSAVVSTIRITAVSGHGFQVERKRFGRKDIPDVYCNIKFGSSPSIFRTKTVKDSLEPVWNESREYKMTSQGQMVHVDVYDEDSGKNDKDDYLGSCRTTVGKLLLAAGGSQEMELQVEGKPTGAYVTFRCEVLVVN